MAGAAEADSIQGQSPGWVNRASELGIESAHVVLGYSLTDDCQLGQVEVLESTSDALFDPAAVEHITKTMIGPFRVANRDIVHIGSSPPEIQERYQMTNRMYKWNTDLGHEYLICRFYSDGSYANAYYSDGRQAEQKVVEDRPVARRLSRLGTRTQKVVFKAEE